MPVYEYKCSMCADRWALTRDIEDRDEGLRHSCIFCGGQMKRVFSFSVAPMMHTHMNPTTGQPVSSMSEFKSQLRRASESAEERTGVKHSFVPVDPRELAHTVTDEGMGASHDAGVAAGIIEATGKVT